MIRNKKVDINVGVAAFFRFKKKKKMFTKKFVDQDFFYRDEFLSHLFHLIVSIPEKLFDKLGEGEDLADADGRLHGDELVQVVLRLGRGDRRVRRRRLHPRAVGLLHVPPVGREGGEKDRGGDDPEEAVVLLGADVMILKMVSPKKWRKNWRFT
jgi:hypothetical protein